MLSNDHCVISVDKYEAYPLAFKSIKDEGLVSGECELLQIKYLNHQDHRFLKRRIWCSQWLQTFHTAKATISGYESMHVIRKGQIEGIGKKMLWLKKCLQRDCFG